MGRRHVLELEVAQSLAYVHPDYLLVPLEGGWPNSVCHAVCQPPIQILAELEVIRVEDEASCRIAPCFGELLLDFLVHPAVDRLGLRSFRRLDRVVEPHTGTPLEKSVPGFKDSSIHSLPQ